MKATVTNISRRLTVRKNRTEGILNYDIDNAYPQRVVNIINGSGVATACIQMYVKFMMGGGFKDKVFYKAKLNRNGLTCDKLLRKICTQLAVHNGIAIHINYNALFEVCEVNYLPFQYCRLTDPESTKANKVAIYDDWDRIKRFTFDKKKIQYVDFFNPNPDIIQEQVTAAGGWDKYKGQIYYWAPGGIEYPLAAFDSILEDIQTDGEIKLFKFRNVTTQFMASHILFSPPVEETDKTDWMNSLEDFQGADNTAKIINIETATPDNYKLQKVDVQNIENIFSYTESSVKENIVRQFNIPPVLMGILQGGKLGTSKEIQDATEFFNGITAPERLVIEEIFSEIMSRFAEKVNPSADYSILTYQNPVINSEIEQQFLPYFTINEVRKNKGYEPIEDGDVRLVNTPPVKN